jgi:outer membrane lipoprotein SlyB
MIVETPANKSPHTLFWIAGIAVTVFSAVGIAAVMGWIPTSTSSPADKIVVVPPATPAAATAPAVSALSAEQARERAREQARREAREESRERLANSANARANARCNECGVIESVREIATKGEGSGLGVVGGAVVGGVLGHQVGGGRGQDIATVAGAVGGAVAGNEIEKRVKSVKSYEITVRLENGSSRVIHEASTPSWRVGDRVRVVNGVIQSNA